MSLRIPCASLSRIAQPLEPRGLPRNCFCQSRTSAGVTSDASSSMIACSAATSLAISAPAGCLTGTARAGDPVSTPTETTRTQRVDLRNELGLPDYLTPRSRSIPLEETCHWVTPIEDRYHPIPSPRFIPPRSAWRRKLGRSTLWPKVA